LRRMRVVYYYVPPGCLVSLLSFFFCLHCRCRHLSSSS
jgi:hypothetical protein